MPKKNLPLEKELPLIIAQSGLLIGQRWVINHSITIGRDPGCDIVLLDRQVSRFHARVSQEQEGILLEDLGSKNGTFHNGVRLLDPHFLADGDQVQIALVQFFTFVTSDATMPLDALSANINKPVGRLHMDVRSRRVWLGDKEILPPLSVPQFRLLQILYEQEGEVISRQDLVQAVWKEDAPQGVSEQALDALVRRLRYRISEIDPNNMYLLTIRGHGIRFVNLPE